MLRLVLVVMLFCANMANAQSLGERWLQAEAAFDSPNAFGVWSDLYEDFTPDAATPYFTKDIIISNLIAISLRDNNYEIALELSDDLSDMATKSYHKLAILRAQSKHESKPKSEQMLVLLDDFTNDDFLNAVVTALLDTSNYDVKPLFFQQKTARHRAYGLHRWHLRGEGVKTLDEAAFNMLLAGGKLAEALNLVAIAPLHKRLDLRNKLLQKLHNEARGINPDLALQSLWLMLKDSPQEKAILQYVEWLTEAGEMAQAQAVAENIAAPKARLKAHYYFRDGYAKGELKDAAQAVIDRLKNSVQQSEFEGGAIPAFDPFKKLYPQRLVFNSKLQNAACADGLALPQLGEPLDALRADDSYGTDRSAEDFAWVVMLQTSRVMAGDAVAKEELKQLLLKWAEAGAFNHSEQHHNAIYALKRTLIPAMVAISALHDEFDAAEMMELHEWLQPLVELSTIKFDGEVDFNNHRYMADAVLLAYGVLTKDAKLYHEGKAGFYRAIAQIDAHGLLPLEAKRGARSVWYMRQSIASLSLMLRIMQLQGKQISVQAAQKLQHLVHNFVSISYNPLLILPQSASNFTAGENSNIFEADMGMLQLRPNLRHYMSFAAYWNQNARLQQMVAKIGRGAKPWVDEFAGGNAQCFMELK